MTTHGKLPILALLAFTAACLLWGDAALAQNTEPLCTNDPKFNIPMPQAGTGIISTIVNNIQLLLSTTTHSLYNSILGSATFQNAAVTAMGIFIVIFGMLFAFGMVQLTAMEVLSRLAKIAIVAALISPVSWNFLNDTVVRFFNNGTDEIIRAMGQVATGYPTAPGNTFGALDQMLAIMTSPKLIATLFATLFFGPYGIVLGILLFLGLGQFAATLFSAMYTYLMSLVVKAFLFALAPIFFSFLLFQRTRNLFDGWLNQLVSASLQPIFLFAFFAFFLQLIRSALETIIAIPVCQVPIPGGCAGGAPESCVMWRFITHLQSVATFSTPFPIPIINILIFLLLVSLAWNLNKVVIKLASDLAGAATNLAMSSNVMREMNPMNAFDSVVSRATGNASRQVTTQMRDGRPRPPGPAA